jgi:hypothetical protein
MRCSKGAISAPRPDRGAERFTLERGGRATCRSTRGRGARSPVLIAPRRVPVRSARGRSARSPGPDAAGPGLFAPWPASVAHWRGPFATDLLLVERWPIRCRHGIGALRSKYGPEARVLVQTLATSIPEARGLGPEARELGPEARELDPEVRGRGPQARDSGPEAQPPAALSRVRAGKRKLPVLGRRDRLLVAHGLLLGRRGWPRERNGSGRARSVRGLVERVRTMCRRVEAPTRSGRGRERRDQPHDPPGGGRALRGGGRDAHPCRRIDRGVERGVRGPSRSRTIRNPCVRVCTPGLHVEARRAEVSLRLRNGHARSASRSSA